VRGPQRRRDQDEQHAQRIVAELDLAEGDHTGDRRSMPTVE
jgi:hypothetical protein